MLLLALLSPYVTLATNQPTSMGGTAGGGEVGEVTDALKVLYTTDRATIASQLARPAPAGAAALQVELPRMLVLPEELARSEVVEALEASTSLVPAAARSVGALRVGFLPVAPTWE